jgi:hypothetical protein
MPNQVGDVGICHWFTPAGEVWVEVETMSLDGDLDDPQTTEYKPLRIAYVLNSGWEYEGKWGKLVDQFKSVDAENLSWNDVPVPYQTPMSDLGFAWRRVI